MSEKIGFYEPVTNPESFYITASDDEGNIVFSLLVKNTAANVSLALSNTVGLLNEQRQMEDSNENDG